MQRMSGRLADRLPSDGYFCADATIQRSGPAVRIMHTRLGTLRPGSIVVCPRARPASGAATRPFGTPPSI